METPWLRFVLVVVLVLVLDFTRDFADEDYDENKENGAFGRFSQALKAELQTGISTNLQASKEDKNASCFTRHHAAGNQK